jgi:hypothetical protein
MADDSARPQELLRPVRRVMSGVILCDTADRSSGSMLYPPTGRHAGVRDLPLPRPGGEFLLTLVRRMQTSAQKTTFVHAVRDVLHQSGELVISQTGPRVPSPCPLPSPFPSQCVWP